MSSLTQPLENHINIESPVLWSGNIKSIADNANIPSRDATNNYLINLTIISFNRFKKIFSGQILKIYISLFYEKYVVTTTFAAFSRVANNYFWN